MFVRLIALFALLLLAAVAYVRLAPTQAASWHRQAHPKEVGDYPATGGFEAIRPLAAPADEVLARLRQTALATPRTRLIAGSVEEGMMTFETRSLIVGFPDYTTVWIVPGEGDSQLLAIHGRLRFGRSDLGVNKVRVQKWLAALDGLIKPAT